MTQKTVSFRDKIAASSALLGLRFFSSIGLRLISTVVLTRLLAPEIYGVFATVMVYIYILEMISDIGLRPLILTREGDVTDRFLRTCWTVSILRGVVILLLSCLIAFALGALQGAGQFAPDSPYMSVDLPLAICLLGFGALIFSFETPNRYMHERNMTFRNVLAVDVARDVITLMVTIALAFYLRSIWALVIGHMIRSCLHLGLSFALFRGARMSLLLDRDSLKVLIDRGKWVLGQSALTAVFQSFDRIFLGFVMSSSSFGFYFIARQLVDVVPKFLVSLNGSMILQVFTHLQKSSPAEFRRNYYRYRLIFDGMAGVAAGGLIVLSPLIVEIVFDDRYRDVAPIMQILVLALLLTGLVLTGNAYTAARKFHVTTYLLMLSSASIVLGLSYATFVAQSVEMALYVIALHRLPEAIVVTILGLRQGWTVLWRELFILGFFAVGALAGWCCLLAWRWLW